MARVKKNNVEADLVVFHWSPRARRRSIERSGLVPGSVARGFGPEKAPYAAKWRPPFVCFSEDPHLAWNLSGAYHPEIEVWDLWMVYANDIPHWEVITDTYRDTGRLYVKEFRVYDRIYKRNVHWIAERRNG